ncbi:MAG: sialate O-acetylesterase [bacterium]
MPSPTAVRIAILSVISALGIAAGAAVNPATRLSAQSVAPVERQGLRLPRLFADGMVLQRDTPIAIWGWADRGADISIVFRGVTIHTAAVYDGTWRATLPPQRAGGPFELSVHAANGRIELHDVLVGDVWVASGQSNIEFTVSAGKNAAQEIASANDSLLRHFKVPNSWSNSPESDLAGGDWSPADSQHVGAFTAVGYFFARDLRKSAHVPIGIINTTWSGSNIETWISRGAQQITDSAWSAIVQREADRVKAIRDSLTVKLGVLPAMDSGMVNDRAPWADPSLDDSGWSELPVPAYWEAHGYGGMDGIAWYRVAFDLSDAELRAGVTVAFAGIDDDDITWVNGVEVGRTTGYNVPRAYKIAASALHAGRNMLAVRVTDAGAGGGINGAVSLTLSNGTQRSLAGAWKFKVGAVSFQPDGQQINKIPSILYNRMVHPLLPFAIKGVIWYQGESNSNTVEQALAYRGQFATLIESWRREWGGGLLRPTGSLREPFPFLWVQLPNFGTPDSAPPTAPAWAVQRESMSAALVLPKTGQAIAIDVGDATNLHPTNKQDVGARLARVARRVAYEEAVVAAGPSYRSHVVREDTVVVEFADLGGGLVTTANDGRVGGFAIAGADRKFVWATARIVGNRVLVWSREVKTPVAVRYAWANNPDRASLYNREHLPAAPFRTDRW